MSDGAETGEEAVAELARAAVERLASEFGPGLGVQVEHAPRTDSGTGTPRQYVDPVAVGGLIVAVATLAWQVYTDLRARTAHPAPDVLARTIRLRLDDAGVDPGYRDRVIEVVINETITRREPTE